MAQDTSGPPPGQEDSTPGPANIPLEGETTRLGSAVWISGLIIALIGLITSILMLQGFESDGYFYLGFYSIAANTAISLFPHEPVLIYFGKEADLLLSATAATVGTVVAAILDHLVFVPVLDHQSISAYKRKRLYRKAINLFMRWPFWTIVVTGFTPIPFFPFKFLAFSIRYPMVKWVTALVVARFPRYYVLALAGATFPIPNWILILSVAVIFGLYLVKAIPAGHRRLRERRRLRAETGLTDSD